MGQTQSYESNENNGNYKKTLVKYLEKGKNNIKRDLENHGNGNLINEIKKINENVKNITNKLSSQINSAINGLQEQVLGEYNKINGIQIKELLINIYYLHETRITFYELLNENIKHVIKSNGLLFNPKNKSSNPKFKINLHGMNEVIYLKKIIKNQSVKDIFKMIKETVLKELSEDKFLLVKNDKTIYDYLVLEMHKDTNEILKRPTVLDTISILKDLFQKLKKKKEYKELLESGDIKQALDNYYENVLKLDKITRIDNLTKAGESIIEKIKTKLKEIKPNSPRTVMTEAPNGGFNKSKINKQDSIKKMKLKQEKEMNKLKLKQKNELLKLKNKQKKELKSKSKKSTNKCCNCKKNFLSKASLGNHKKKCN